MLKQVKTSLNRKNQVLLTLVFAVGLVSGFGSSTYLDSDPVDYSEHQCEYNDTVDRSVSELYELRDNVTEIPVNRSYNYSELVCGPVG